MGCKPIFLLIFILFSFFNSFILNSAEEMRNNTVRRFGDVQSSSSNYNFYGNHSNQANGKSTRNEDEDFQVDFEEERPIRPPNPVPGYHSYNNYSRGTYHDQGGLNQYGRKKRHPKHMPLKKTELELFQNGVEQGERFGDQYGFDKDDEIFVSGGSDESVQGLRIQNFQECGFSRILLGTITQCCKYEYPTPIQRAVIPLIMNKRDDIMGYSQTGSGKTAAFLIPIIHELQRIIQTNNHQNMRLPKNSPLCIILSPTKELAEQLYHNALKFAVKTGVTVARSFGDMPMRETLAEKERGCDIFVVTPGRLRHHLDDAHIDISNLRYFVLDEGDKLIEERHFNVSIDACKLHPNYPPTTRLLIFSASFTDIVQSMADNYLREGYIFVKIGQINELVDTVEQEFIEVTKIDKAARLLEILQTDAVEKIRPDQSGRYFKPKYKTLIFVDNKRISDRTAMYLKQQGFTGTMSINSDRSLKQRMDAYEKFKNGQYDVLVATDVASRGWDISKIELVINYDLPMQESGDESFIHRIGRTGRAGNVGKAISFFDPYDQSNVQKADIYIKLLRAKNSNVPEFLLRHSTENREEKRQQVYMEGRIYGERENAWGGDRNPQNYFEQENDYLKIGANNRQNNGQNNGMNNQMNLNGPEDGWRPSNFNQQTNGRPMKQQNNFNGNGMASTSAPIKPPMNIFDLDDDDEEEEYGQSSSRQNVPTYQAPNNYRNEPQPQPLNNYQPNKQNGHIAAYQSGNSNNQPRPLNSFHQHQPPQNGYTGTYQNGNQQNNLNWNGGMASTSAPKKPPMNIFDLDDDDDEGVEEDITTMRYGQSSSSKPNIPAYQAPNNYGNGPPKTMNNYQPRQNGYIGAYQNGNSNNFGHQPRPLLNSYQNQPAQNGHATTYQNGNRQNMEKNQSSNFNNNSNGFPVQKEHDQTRFPSPNRNRDIIKQQRYGIRADLKEQKYDDCF